jgi:hypothetical protein
MIRKMLLNFMYGTLSKVARIVPEEAINKPTVGFK